MNRLEHKANNQKRRQTRVAAKIYGTKNSPRLSVKISNRNVTAQLIDDTSGSTLAYVSSASETFKAKSNLTEKASWVGGQIAQKANSAKIKRAVLDRGSRIYHGRIKALADEARKTGLEI